MNDAESSASFMSALAAFSKSLSESEIAIYGVAYDFLHFGSWTIELGKRHANGNWLSKSQSPKDQQMASFFVPRRIWFWRMRAFSGELGGCCGLVFLIWNAFTRNRTDGTW